MSTPDPRYDLPTGWVGPRDSRKPLQMLTAEMFNRSFTPSPDGTVHVAPLRRPPIGLVIMLGLFAVAFMVIVWAVLDQAGTTPAMQGPAPYVVAVLFGLFGLLFALSFINALFALRTRGSWINRECVALGRTGIIVRTQGAPLDIPWDQVSGIRALAVTGRGRRGASRPPLPVLRLEYRDGHRDIAVAVLDAAPAVLYRLLHHYWLHPQDRAELGTSLAQQRMDALWSWLSAAEAPTRPRGGSTPAR